MKNAGSTKKKGGFTYYINRGNTVVPGRLLERARKQLLINETQKHQFFFLFIYFIYFIFYYFGERL